MTRWTWPYILQQVIMGALWLVFLKVVKMEIQRAIHIEEESERESEMGGHR